MPEAGSGILGYLKKQNRDPSELPLNVLRQFQEFEKMLQNGLKSYEGKEDAVTYGMQSYTKVELLAIALIESGDYPAVKKCHDHLMRLFKNDDAFSDGISLMSWIMFNFPCSPNGNVLAQEILNQSPSLKNQIGPFINEAVNSRMGLYKVIDDSPKECHLIEFYTNRKLKLGQSLGGIASGNIVLCRVIKLLGKYWSFGDTPEFPASKYDQIKMMVENKMLFPPFIHENSVSKSYSTLMRLAGPYWFSIIARDFLGDILDINSYMAYYN